MDSDVDVDADVDVDGVVVVIVCLAVKKCGDEMSESRRLLFLLLAIMRDTAVAAVGA